MTGSMSPIAGFVGWETVYDLAEDTDLSRWDAPINDAVFELVDGVIRQTNEGASHPVITLHVAPLLAAVADRFPIGVAWQVDARITRPLTSGEFVIVDGYEFGIEFADDGTVDDDSGGNEAPVVVGQWYTARVVAMFNASGAVSGVTTTVDAIIADAVEHVGSILFPNRKVRIDLTVGTEPLEVRNVRVHALVAHEF